MSLHRYRKLVLKSLGKHLGKLKGKIFGCILSSKKMYWFLE